jgi:hypothetical protein
MPITFKVTGSFQHTETFLRNVSKRNIPSILQKYAQKGVHALQTYTPEDSGLAAHSWDYLIEVQDGTYRIVWTNTDVENGFPVAIMLQYGYATGTGGYVQGRDYINPAMKPIFDEIADEVWRAVTSA